MEIVKTATRGATITRNLHKTGSGRGYFSTTSGSGLPRSLAETYFLHFHEVRHAFRDFFSSAPSDVAFLLSSIF